MTGIDGEVVGTKPTDRVANQIIFEKEVEPTLFGTDYASRLWATATCLAGEKSATFRMEQRMLGGEVEVPKPEEIQPLVEATTVAMSMACENCQNSLEGNRIAGASYILTAIIQPFDDGNKQIARLLSGSYLKEYDKNAQDYAFSTPDQDVSLGLTGVIHPDGYFQKMPAEESIATVISTIGNLDESQKEILKLLLEDQTKTEERMEFRQQDKMLRKLGGDENDQTGSSEDSGKQIYNQARKDVLYMQQIKFLIGVLKNPDDFVKMIKGQTNDLSPELKLMDSRIEDYLKAIPEVLVDKDHIMGK